MLIPIALILNFLFLVYWTIRLSWKVIFSLVILILGYPFISATLSLSWPQSVDHAGSIKVLSYNVRVFNSYKYLKEKNNSNAHKMLKYIRESNADIVCLQEFYFKKNSDVFNTMERLTKNGYPYSYFRKSLANNQGGTFGIAIFSKYPILNKRELEFSKLTRNQAIYIDIKVNNKKLRVYNLHLQSIHINEKEITEGQFDKGSTKNIIEVLKRMKEGYVERAKQLKIVTKSFPGDGMPVLICGDFNDTPYSYYYQLLSKQFDNAFEEKGWGLGATYNGNISFLRIDNQFYDPRSLRVLEFHTDQEASYSDHFPIWAEYEFF